MPASWSDGSVAAQEGDPDSMLALTRRALSRRPDGPFSWLEGPPGALVFRRGDTICAVNVDAVELPLPAGELLLASAPGVVDSLPPNTAAWVRAPEGATT
jgi:alpha-glucosidase